MTLRFGASHDTQNEAYDALLKHRAVASFL